MASGNSSDGNNAPSESQTNFGEVSRQLNYSAGLLKSLKVSHNRDAGTAQMKLVFRNLPSNGQIISFGISSSYSGLNPVSGMVCSETEGAQLRKFPNLKLSYPNSSDYKVKSISATGKLLTVVWENEDLKALTSWNDSYSALPTCFGVSTWIKKREYSSGTNCRGFLNQGFLNANCEPYAGWNTWEEVSKSWRILFPIPEA